MIYHLDIPADLRKANAYLIKLIKLGKRVEIKELKPPRTTKQNAYLHLILGILAKETGYTLPEIKIVWKRQICSDLFIYSKPSMNGKGTALFERSSADMDSKQLTQAIDRLREFSNTELDIRLPLPDDQYYLDHAYNELNQ